MAVTMLGAESGSGLRRVIEPWWRRLYFSVNYLPVTLCGMFGILVSLVAVGVRSSILALSVSLLWVFAFAELVGRRPYVTLVGSNMEIRNLTRARVVPLNAIAGLELYTFRLRKDTCPAIRLSDHGKSIPVFAYFGLGREPLLADLDSARRR